MLVEDFVAATDLIIADERDYRSQAYWQNVTRILTTHNPTQNEVNKPPLYVLFGMNTHLINTPKQYVCTIYKEAKRPYSRMLGCQDVLCSERIQHCNHQMVMYQNPSSKLEANICFENKTNKKVNIKWMSCPDECPNPLITPAPCPSYLKDLQLKT